MPNRLQKLIYYLSAAAPILITFSIVWYIQKKTWIFPLLFIIASIILIFLFNCSFDYATKNLPSIPVEVLEINGDDGWLVAYAVTYFMPLMSIKLNDFIAPIVVVVLFILMLVLTFTDYISPHPILFFRGYHFYEVSVRGAHHNMKLVSEKILRDATTIRLVNRASEFLLILASKEIDEESD